MIASDFEVSAFPDPKAWLAAIVESSDDAIVGKRLDGTIVSWNDGAERVFGYTAEEIVGKSVLTLFPPELRKEEVGIVARLSRGERVDHYETIRVRKDGKRINVSLSVSPIRDESGMIVGAAKIARDVTAQKELEAKLTQLNAELQRQVELARRAQEQAETASRAKTEFLATMSHELRTPLNAIGGYADLLEAGVEGELAPQHRDYVARIRRNQRHLLELINSLLDLSKVEAGQVELRLKPVKVAEVFAQLEAMTGPQAMVKDHTLRIVPPEEGLAVLADPDRVLQVMINLVGNAIKFTPPGGSVTIGASATARDVSVAVRDTGPGVPPADQARIFERFVQLDRSLSSGHEGAGLGLAISRDLARAMHGDLTIASKGNGKGGSTFTLRLPRAR
jgi:PAS domain S-box-containing protein